MDGVRVGRIDAGQRSLGNGLADVAPGALSALSVVGGVVAGPVDGARLLFGRNRLEVDVCVGEDDLRVSRVHGTLGYRTGRWWLTNTGRTPIRMPNSVLLHKGSDPLPLAAGYLPLFLLGTRDREHVLEIHVAGASGGRPPRRPDAETEEPKRWRLTADEHLALVATGQRYLLYDPQAQPVSRQLVAGELAELAPDGRWTAKKVEHLVADVRERLSASGVAGLRRDEVGEPIGLTLVSNLLRELMRSSTLVPMDLELLERPVSAPSGRPPSAPAR